MADPAVGRAGEGSETYWGLPSPPATSFLFHSIGDKPFGWRLQPKACPAPTYQSTMAKYHPKRSTALYAADNPKPNVPKTDL